MEENKSVICVKENIITKIKNFLKSIFKRKGKVKEETTESFNKNKKSKENLLKIYEKAKIGEYDIKSLDTEDIKMLNKLIEAEIEIKTKKLNEIITDTKMKQYALKHN